MARRKIPKYRLHKASGQARVTIDGRTYYLGKHGTHESRQEYNRLIGRMLADESPREDGERGRPLRSSVNELLLAFWRHAKEHYRKHGRTTSRLDNYRPVIKTLQRLYGHDDVADFTPGDLHACRLAFIEAGNCRKTVNDKTHCIRHIFKWGVEHQLVPGAVWRDLTAVAGLQRGRSAAVDHPPKQPVSRDQVDAVRPFVAPQVAALLDLLWYSGARPGEMCLIRMVDLDTSGKAWRYTPAEHKTEHHGKDRRIWLGPRCQMLLRPWFRQALTEYLFSPLEAEQSRNGPDWKPGRRDLGGHYTTATLRHAIHRACDRAFPPPAPLAQQKDETERQWMNRLSAALRDELRAWRRKHRWSPNQLRHAWATEVTNRYETIEAAASTLGNRVNVAELYAQRSDRLAQRVALECG